MTVPTDPDQRIAAFLDGAMSYDQAAAFAALLEQDPVLAAKVERLVRNDSLLRKAFALPAGDEADDAMLARMGLAPAPNRAPASAPELPLAAAAANDNYLLWRKSIMPLGGTIAAAVVLAVALSLGGNKLSPIGAALETTPSGQTAALDGGAAITPVLTFTAKDGRFCREFTYSADSGNRGAIACRGQSDWEVEAWGDGPARLPDPDAIALASGADGTSLDDAYSRLGASDPLAIDRERISMASGWNLPRQ